MNVSANKLVAKQPLIQEFYHRWMALREEIYSKVPHLPHDTEILCQIIDKSLQNLSELRLTIVVAGTTDSGKSSLANLLCGAGIMPTGVNETSACSVVIDHHPTDRILRIPPVAGLPDECSGEWTNLSDTEIRQRLERLMKGYLELRYINREPPAPRIELQYPIRLAQQPELMGLPEGFRLRVIDLPGLKFVSDDHNRQEIRAETKQAFCLLTYDSADTDPVRSKVLLKEIVQTILALGDSLARMLFILNKMDVFLTYSTGAEYQHEFIRTKTTQIRSEIAEGLPEYNEQAQAITPLPLSTYPALSAYRALNESTEECIYELERLNNNFYSLLPSIIEDLPRRVKKWRDEERKQAAQAVWQASYGEQFDKALQRHIHEHFLQPLFIQYDQLFDAMGAALAAVNAAIRAEIRYDAALAVHHATLLTEINAFRTELPRLLF